MKNLGKAKDVYSLPNNYIVVQVETTGISYGVDDITEVSLLKVKDGIIVEKLTSYGTNGLFDKLSDFLEGYTLISSRTGHHISFLRKCFSDFYNEDFPNKTIDILQLAKKVNKDLPNHRLITLLEYYNIDDEDELEKCNQIHLLYQQLRDIEVADSGKPKSSKRAGDYEVTENRVTDGSPFVGKVFVFTGALGEMDKSEAKQKVVNLGGIIKDGVSRKVDYVVVGDFSNCHSVQGNLSTKHKKAIALQEEGVDLKIMFRDEFLDLFKKYY